MITTELKARLDGLTFKTTELTVGESIYVQKLKNDSDVSALLQLIASRVEGNADGSRFKPSELWDLTLSELAQFVEKRVLAGVMTGMTKMQSLGSKLSRVH